MEDEGVTGRRGRRQDGRRGEDRRKKGESEADEGVMCDLPMDFAGER